MKSAVILAAGLSSRMMDFKPLLPFGGTTVIQHTVSRMLEGGAEEIILVTGFLATEVERIFRDSRVRFVHNRDYAKSQMFDSVCLGLAAARGDEIFLLPALPKNWQEGSITGICAEGGFEVDMTWEKGRFSHGWLLSKHGEKAVLRCREELEISKDGIKVSVIRDEKERYVFDTEKDAIYQIRSK